MMSRERLDVVLMDYRLPDGTGAEATRAIKARWPAARVVMVTALTDDETVLESIQAGADGYLTKDRAAEDVVAAVRAAHAGETLLPRSVIVEIARRVAAARERGDERRIVEPLTPRELEVLRALTEGLSTPEICERLFIAPNTLRTHVQNIMGKLRVHSKLEAVAFALQVPARRPAEARGRPSRDQLDVGAPVRTLGSVASSPAGRRGAADSRRPVARPAGGGPARRSRGPPLLGRRARIAASARRSAANRSIRRSTCAAFAEEDRPAARAPPLLGEERLERRDGVDLASARPAGEPGMGRS